MSPLLQQLIDALKCLPGVGPKSAQRMAFYLLERDTEGATNLSSALVEAVDKIGHCSMCRTLSETTLCEICASTSRDSSSVCVLETPADVFAIENTAEFRGKYFVLMGHLSPLDGIGPEELGLEKLGQRFEGGEITEVILATNPTVEGEATALYVSQLLEGLPTSVTHLARGVPVGGSIEYLDEATLGRALEGRRQV